MEQLFRVVPGEASSEFDVSTDKVVIDWHEGPGFYHLSEAGTRPVPMIMPEVAGIFVGGCVAKGPGSRLEVLAIAHAHTGSDDQYQGWICFCKPQIFDDPQYHCHLWHEYAHILTMEGHTKKWRQTMRDLGQPVLRRYIRKGQCS